MATIWSISVGISLSLPPHTLTFFYQAWVPESTRIIVHFSPPVHHTHVAKSRSQLNPGLCLFQNNWGAWRRTHNLWSCLTLDSCPQSSPSPHCLTILMFSHSLFTFSPSENQLVLSPVSLDHDIFSWWLQLLFLSENETNQKRIMPSSQVGDYLPPSSTLHSCHSLLPGPEQ